MTAKTKPTVKRKPKSEAMAAVLDAARGMASVGMINAKTMRAYEELCTVPELTADDVVRIRNGVHASQGYFARALNVSSSTVQQWESGKKKPSGIAAKMLSVVKKHGLEILA